MSVTPRISLVAYEDRVGGFVFVAVPNERGRYIRTDKSVVLVDCPLCRAVVGEPCKTRVSGDGYGATTHAVRRERTKAKHYGVRGEDQVDPVGIESMGFSFEVSADINERLGLGMKSAEIAAPHVNKPAPLLGSIDLIEPKVIA